MSPKQRFQLMLEPLQLAKLRFIETRIGVPVAEQVRRGIEQWLEGDVIAQKVLEDFSAERPTAGGRAVARKIKRSR